MLLTYNSLLVTRKTDVWGRRFSVLSTWSQLCDILWRICIHLLRTTRTKKDVGSTWEANLILGAESQMFWDPPIIGYFWQTTSSLIFFCQVLSGEFQAYLPQRMQPALGVKCPLTAAAPVRWSLPAPPGCLRQVTAILSTCRKPASRTSRPVHSVDDFRVSNCFKFFKQVELKPFWFTLVTWRMRVVDHP